MTPSSTRRIFLLSLTVSLMFISINGMDCAYDSDCDNGGSCVGNGICDCTPSYTGPNCEFLSSCADNECLNGATCVPDGMEYTCDCRPAHRGIYCTFLVNYTSCDPNPCQNGECVDLGNENVLCDCTPFTSGAFCERTPNCDNNNPCRHGGTCKNGAMDDPATCVCGPDWTGDICQFPSTCDLSPCQNGGTCTPFENSAICSCTDLWEGPTCEDAVTTCTTTGCDNGGTCANGICECTEFYTGEFCEFESACFFEPCENGGTCVPISSSSTPAATSTPDPDLYYCECPSGYSGALCERRTPCIPNPCLNNGVCSPQGGMPSYACDCTSGFQGPNCGDSQPNTPMNNSLSQTTIGIIAGSVAAVVIVIIIIAAIACFCCRKKRDDDKDRLTGLEMGANQRGRPHDYVPSPTKNRVPAIPNLRVSRMRDETKMEFPRNRLTLINKLGSGSFADVYKAEAVGIITKEKKSIVAVKRLKETATENDKSDLSKELSLYMYLDPHPNIVNILGCCTDVDPWYIIMEYLPNGNLQGYLRQIRTGESITTDYKNVKKQKDIPPNDLLNFGVQIARGMEYLASRACIHRDLAARNILLGEGFVCKVSDFGLARDLEDGQTYEMKSQGRVPVRWMSPESLLHNTYTSQSDVWSFAILIWEIVTLGSHPYPGMSSKQVVKEISAGYRLPKPEHCSQDIYNLMKECWAYEAEERPTFSQVKVRLENMLADAQGYLVMSDFNDDNYLYLEPDAHTGDTLDEGFSHME